MAILMLKIKCEECDKNKKDVYWSPDAQANICTSCAKRMGVRLERNSERELEDDDMIDMEAAENQLNRMGRLLE
jgi:formate dehydrogenase maturation protein FdhE